MNQSSQKIDRRVVKTRIALREAMMLLLVEQGWDDLSVQAICDKANVGRSTFYLHYPSKNDLLLEGLGEFRDELLTHTADLSAKPVAGILGGLLDHMSEQLPVFRTVIGWRSAQIVAGNFKAMLVELIELDLKRHQHPAAEKPWLIRFLAGGVYESMAWWVDAAKPCSVQDLEMQMSKVINIALEQS